MARQTEGSINHDLAAALRRLHPAWNDQTVLAESTDVLGEGAGLRPDIVITNRLRTGGVILETEVEPAPTVQDDALARLGTTFAADGSPVEQVVAVRIPATARTPGARLDTLTFRYKVCTNGTEALSWFPADGWIEGTLADLAGFVETVAVSPRRLEEGVNALETGVRQAANIIRQSMQTRYQFGLEEMADILHQHDGEQTTRMAAAIIANALTVHSAIATVSRDVRTLSEPSMRGYENVLLQSEVLATWRAILDINYWPIFDVACRVLGAIDEAVAGQALTRLAKTASTLQGLGATTIGDLAGQMFGQLIADRKFLATFYTRHSAAALLAELAVARLDTDWGNQEEVVNLRIADLACGTGSLLSAIHRRIVSRVRRAGLDDGDLHARLMENVLIGCDIMPAATHLTAAQLTAAHPTITFGDTRIHTMPYGEHDPGGGKRIFIGSLELLDDDTAPTLLGTGATTVTGTGELDDAGGRQLDLPNGSIDLVIMNPPFTRPTNHEIADVPVPSFAGFETSTKEQENMSRRLTALRRKLAHEPAGHGNAGLASDFVDLAHAKLRHGGVLALIVPASIVSGDAWDKTRTLLADHYQDITVATVAEVGTTTRAFSADTGMAEAIIVATKRIRRQADDGPVRADYLVLEDHPASLAEAVEIVRSFSAATGRGRIAVGGQHVGWSISGAFGPGAAGHPSGVSNPDVAIAASSLADGRLRLPRHEVLVLPVTHLGALGTRGPVDRDISGKYTGRGRKDDEDRGPFDIVRLGNRATYTRAGWPVLWSHEAALERRMIVLPCSEGIVRAGKDDAALKLWNGFRNANGADIAGAGRLHINRDFQLNSQSLGACLTPVPTIGGRAWPSFAPTPDGDSDLETWEKVLALWSNTTLGLIARWWVSNRQQKGRACLTVTTLGAIPVLNCRRLAADKLSALAAAFDRLADSSLLPANEAYRDPARAALDEAVLCDALELPDTILDPLATLREQWCAEPSVHGGKGTGPAGTG